MCGGQKKGEFRGQPPFCRGGKFSYDIKIRIGREQEPGHHEAWCATGCFHVRVCQRAVSPLLRISLQWAGRILVERDERLKLAYNLPVTSCEAVLAVLRSGTGSWVLGA